MFKVSDAFLQTILCKEIAEDLQGREVSPWKRKIPEEKFKR
jgi:hypothetical protein